MLEPNELLERLNEHAGFLRAVARRLVRDPATVDDLVQESLLRAAVNPAAERASQGWLATVVRSVFFDRRSAEQARLRREQRHATAAAQSNREESRDPLGVDELVRALGALPSEYRIALQLRFYAHRTFQEMANEQGVPIGTAKTRVRRGLELLRVDLTARLGGEARWRALLVSWVATVPGGAAAPAGAAGVCVLTGVLLMKKIVVALAVLGFFVVLSLARPLEFDPTAAPQAVAEPDSARQSVAAIDRSASGPVPLAAGNTAGPLERSVATSADWSVLSGRIVHVEAHRGVPFFGVEVMHGGSIEFVRADEDGRFRTERTYPPSATIRAVDMPKSAPTTLLAEPAQAGDVAVDVTDGTRLELVGQSVLVGIPQRAEPARLSVAVPPSRGDGGHLEQDYLNQDLVATEESMGGDRGKVDGAVRVDTFASPDAIELAVACGPTYIVRTVLPDGRAEHEFRMSLALSPETDGAWVAEEAGLLAALQAVPGATGRYWCRFERRSWIAQGSSKPRLCAFSEDGLWQASAEVAGATGVQGEEVLLEWVARGSLAGVVRNGVGRPLIGVGVSIGSPAHGLLYISSARTDEHGRYRFRCVPVGRVCVSVDSERFEPWRTDLDVRPACEHELNIMLAERPIAGAIRGRIRTASGKPFPASSVHLLSRGDRSLWRTAQIEWVEQGDGLVGAFAFENVPLIECEVRMNTFSPCRAPVRDRRVTPPDEGVEFLIDDLVPLREISFRATKDGDQHLGYAVRLVGDDGWVDERWIASGDLETFSVPVGLGIEWFVFGEDVRLQRGRIPGEQRGPIVVPLQGGYSARAHCFDAANFHPAKGVPLVADGRLLGATDSRGDLLIDLPEAPRTFGLGTTAWRLYGSQTLCSSVDPQTGALRPSSETGRTQLTFYLLQLDDW
jgi:RNA polymerase sigma-70 factor, ECF subfamily